MKVAIIGAGSTYTPELMEGLLEEAEVLQLGEVALMDISQDRLSIVGGLARRMAGLAGGKVSVTLTQSLEIALAGASFVVIQIRVGGQQARHVDEIICKKHGVLGQETTGAGGFAKAMRTIPVVLRILDAIEDKGDHPVILNFTNPSGIITEALSRLTECYVVGLCNIPLKLQMKAAELVGVSPEEIYLDYLGLNHLSWVTGVYVSGTDITQRVLQELAAERATDGLPPPQYEREFIGALGAAPTSYLKYYYLPEEMRNAIAACSRTRAQAVIEIEQELLRVYSDPSLAQKPMKLSQRGGAYYSKAAVGLIRSIVLDSKDIHIVNTANKGAIEGLLPDSVVEVPAVIRKQQAMPLAIGRIGPHMLGLMQHVKAYEQLTIEAAVKCSYDLALLALATNPLVQSSHLARRLLDDFVQAHGLNLT